jgi:photosystem II stability/assembly factor-like uncharacterized protein
MKQTIVFVLGLFLFVTQSGAQQLNQYTSSIPPQQQSSIGWTQVYQETNASWKSISFASRDTAFAFGTRTLLRSIDGGSTWQHIPSPPAFVGSFSDAQNGFVGAGDSAFHTSDAGDTWTVTYDSIPNVAALFAVTKDSAFITRGTESIRGTSDGGKTWQLNSSIINSSGINAMTFLDSKHGIVVGNFTTGPFSQSGAGCFTTSDGGKTWVQQYTGVTGTLYGATYLSADKIIAFGDDGSSAYVILSTNGGHSWVSNIPPAFGSQKGFSAISSKNGHILGVGVEGLILASTDGVAWQTESSGTNVNLIAVAMLDDSIAFAGGDNGVILKTTNGGADWVQTFPSTSQVFTSQVHPQPANGVVQLSYILPQPQLVTLSISDETGREVAVPSMKQLQSSGNHAITVDCTKWATGVYSYRIETECYHSTGKFTIVK